MKKWLLVVVAVFACSLLVKAGDKGNMTPEMQKLKEECMKASKEEREAKKEAMKQLGKDEAYKQLLEKRKEVEKEIADYIKEKCPAYAEASDKCKALRDQMNALKKGAKKGKKPDGQKKKKKVKDGE